MKYDNKNKQGFTLIELSIVLVIIGLIVGGVLVGQDLIKAAQIRATVSQVEKYNAAANTFRTKYNGLPGDLPAGANFFNMTSGAGTGGLGDGNRLIEGTYATGAPDGFLDGEPTVFWGELAATNLIAEPISTTALSYTVATDITSAATAPLVPAAKMGKGNTFGVVAGGGFNYFVLGKSTGITTNATAVAGLTPTEAYQIDTKLDDGAPGTGTVLSTAATYAAPQTKVLGSCGTADATYAISTSGNSVGCTISVRTSF